jgi:hypothetical protein
VGINPTEVSSAYALVTAAFNALDGMTTAQRPAYYRGIYEEFGSRVEHIIARAYFVERRSRPVLIEALGQEAAARVLHALREKAAVAVADEMAGS